MFATPAGQYAVGAPQNRDAVRSVEAFDTQSVTSWRGQLQSLDGEEAKIAGDTVVHTVELANLRRLQFVDRADDQAISDLPRQLVTLRDGSRVAIQSMSFEPEKGATLVLSDGSQLSIAPKKLADVRLKQLSEAQQTQWEAFRQSRLSADMLVLTRSADVLDKIEGVIQSMTDEVVNFEFDDQQIPAPVSRLAGIRFFSAGEESLLRLAAIVRDTRGGRWNAAKLRLEPGGDALSLQLRCGAELELPLAAIADIDFSVGSQKYLSELELVERTTQSRFALPVEIAGSSQVFGARPAGSDIEFLGGGTITYRVPEEFSQLRGSVELAPPGNKTTPCLVQILIEKKVVWEQRLTEIRQPATFELPVTSDQRIQLLVKAESALPVGDIVVFRDVRFLK